MAHSAASSPYLSTPHYPSLSVVENIAKNRSGSLLRRKLKIQRAEGNFGDDEQEGEARSACARENGPNPKRKRERIGSESWENDTGEMKMVIDARTSYIRRR